MITRTVEGGETARQSPTGGSLTLRHLRHSDRADRLDGAGAETAGVTARLLLLLPVATGEAGVRDAVLLCPLPPPPPSPPSPRPPPGPVLVPAPLVSHTPVVARQDSGLIQI